MIGRLGLSIGAISSLYQIVFIVIEKVKSGNIEENINITGNFLVILLIVKIATCLKMLFYGACVYALSLVMACIAQMIPVRGVGVQGIQGINDGMKKEDGK